MIYLDNASTSYPKAPGVGTAMAHYVERVGVNVSRGDYAPAMQAQGAMLDLRERLLDTFDGECVEGVIITSGATHGLNMALKGFLRAGDHVLISAMEHNAVMRPLHQLEGMGVEVQRIPCGAEGTLSPEAAASLFRSNTRMLCVTHGSNVCGTLLPIHELSTLCKRHGAAFVLDASQTVGHVPISCRDIGIDAMLFSAHKGLLGPQGIGAAILTRAFAEALSPLMTGGTGSRSDMEEQPSFLPDKLECGTPNLPGVYGFLAGLSFVNEHFSEFEEKERQLCKQFLEGLWEIKGVHVPGVREITRRVGVVSVDFERLDNGEAAYRLEKEFGILTRCGLHCAPSAHKTLGTYPQGTVRFSLGYTTTRQEVEAALAAVQSLCRGA